MTQNELAMDTQRLAELGQLQKRMRRFELDLKDQSDDTTLRTEIYSIDLTDDINMNAYMRDSMTDRTG